MGHCTGKKKHGGASKGQREVMECLGLVSKCSEAHYPYKEALVILKKSL